MACLALAPVAIVASPSGLNFPVDILMGIIFPLHSHIGMNYVLTDYIPKFPGKAFLGPARAIWLGVTTITFLGLGVLNFKGPGITATLAALWSKPEKKAIKEE